MVLPHEPEFQQAYNELVSALEDSTLFTEKPEYKKVIPVVSVPEKNHPIQSCMGKRQR